MWERDAVLLPRTYVDIVLAAGGVPVLLPPDGGGGKGRSTGATPCCSAAAATSPPTATARPAPRRRSPAHPERDTAELVVLDRALELDLPVLGVCRGAQLLNVALGGTLHQHLPGRGAATTGTTRHRACSPTSTSGSTRPGASGPPSGRTLRVRCHHHQAVDRLAPGLVATGWAADGTVEAVELAGDDPARPFVVGVQWHPEEDAADVRLVAALVAAARRHVRPSPRARRAGPAPAGYSPSRCSTGGSGARWTTVSRWVARVRAT